MRRILARERWDEATVNQIISVGQDSGIMGEFDVVSRDGAAVNVVGTAADV